MSSTSHFFIIVEDIREAFLEEIRLTGIQDLFPAIRSKLFASLKGFPLLSGVLLNYVVGTALLELCYSYFVIGKSKILFLLRNCY